jgi:hypothetical protein
MAGSLVEDVLAHWFIGYLGQVLSVLAHWLKIPWLICCSKDEDEDASLAGDVMAHWFRIS